MRNKYTDRKLNVRTIRQSVIANLRKPVSADGQSKGLHEIQYFTGHRKIRNTVRYRQTGLEELKTAIMKYHPLNQIKILYEIVNFKKSKVRDIMDIKTEKLELIQWLAGVRDMGIIKEFVNLKKSKEVDWWDTISAEEQA